MDRIGDYTETSVIKIQGQRITFHWKKVKDILYYDLYNNGGLKYKDIQDALKKEHKVKKVKSHFWGGWAYD